MDDKKILVELVNLDSTDDSAAEEFVKRHGALKENEAAIYTLEWAQKFREAWNWRQLTGERIERTVNRYLEDIFKMDAPTFKDLGPRPALRADFLRNRWEPYPRNLLDRLALELMRSRKMLHICENPDCHRYFIKAFSRDKYHDMRCSEKMRGEGQRKWAEDKREEINRRRRKPSQKRRTA